jgi:hypothetical protein
MATPYANGNIPPPPMEPFQAQTNYEQQRGFGQIDTQTRGAFGVGFADRPTIVSPYEGGADYNSRSVGVDAVLGALTLSTPLEGHNRFRILSDARLDFRRDAARERALGAQAPDDFDDLQDFLVNQAANNVLPDVVANRIGNLRAVWNETPTTRGERISRRFRIAAQAARVAVAASVTFPEMTRRAGRVAGSVIYRNPPDAVADWLYGAPARPARPFQAADPGAGRPYDIPARPANPVRDPYRPEWAVSAMARNRALGIGAAILAAPATLVRYQRRRR